MKEIKTLKDLDWDNTTCNQYFKKSIGDAVRHMPPKFKKEFVRAWRECGSVDIYGGEPARYMQIIAQHLEYQNEKVSQMEKLIDGFIYRAKKDMWNKGILPRV